MLKTLALSAAIGAMTALVAVPAGAMPLSQSKQTVENEDITAVRDGCGRGFRYSSSRGRCVRVGGPGPGVVVPIPGLQVIIPGVRRGCGPGSRWSPRWGRCVRF